MDNFKFINDSFGHDVGDEVIRLAANAMRRNVRNIDLVGRMGGDEFAILFPETGQDNARKAVSRLQQKLLAAMNEDGKPVAFSIGVLTCVDLTCGAIELFKAADKLMYQAKQAGKNSICYGHSGDSGERGEVLIG